MREIFITIKVYEDVEEFKDMKVVYIRIRN